MTSPTRLGQIAGVAPKAPPASSYQATKLGARVAGGRRGETMDLPFLGIARVELLGAVAANEVEAESYRRFAVRGLELTVLTETRFVLERAVCTLARAIRDPDDHARPFGTLDEWGELDEETILGAWSAYGDLSERLNPMAEPMTGEDVAGIEMAIKKKDGPLLRSYGVKRLSAWLLSTDGRPWISPIQSSWNSASSRSSSSSPAETTSSTPNPADASARGE